MKFPLLTSVLLAGCLLLLVAGCEPRQTNSGTQDKFDAAASKHQQKAASAAAGNALKTNAAPASPPVVGTFGPLGTDIGCWFYRRDMPEHGPVIFYYQDPENISMRINDQEIYFVDVTRRKNARRMKFIAPPFEAFVEPGPKKGLCGHEYPNATITVTQGDQKTVVPAKGGCECEMGDTD